MKSFSVTKSLQAVRRVKCAREGKRALCRAFSRCCSLSRSCSNPSLRISQVQDRDNSRTYHSLSHCRPAGHEISEEQRSSECRCLRVPTVIRFSEISPTHISRTRVYNVVSYIMNINTYEIIFPRTKFNAAVCSAIGPGKRINLDVFGMESRKRRAKGLSGDEILIISRASQM